MAVETNVREVRAYLCACVCTALPDQSRSARAPAATSAPGLPDPHRQHGTVRLEGTGRRRYPPRQGRVEVRCRCAKQANRCLNDCFPVRH
jgi:hypothetical protein